MSAPDSRFGSSRGVLRSEDEPLLRGNGRFTDDLESPGAAHAAFRKDGALMYVDYDAIITSHGLVLT